MQPNAATSVDATAGVSDAASELRRGGACRRASSGRHNAPQRGARLFCTLALARQLLLTPPDSSHAGAAMRCWSALDCAVCWLSGCALTHFDLRRVELGSPASTKTEAARRRWRRTWSERRGSSGRGIAAGLRGEGWLLADIFAAKWTGGGDGQRFRCGEVLGDAMERRWTDESGQVDQASEEERQRRQPRKLPGPEQSRMTYE